LIVQDFVQKYGEKVMSEPPAKGFNSIAWYIPGVAFAIGLGIVVTLIRLWRQRDVARLATVSGAPPVPPTADSELRDIQLERAKRQVDRETEE
jgi:cytochrome c-type biogenesis protein CcmH/NrfF